MKKNTKDQSTAVPNKMDPQSDQPDAFPALPDRDAAGAGGMAPVTEEAKKQAKKEAKKEK